MRPVDTLALSIFGVSVAYAIFRLLLKDRNAKPLPPGPKGFPIMGNANDMPKPGVLEAHHWLEHKDKYGSSIDTHH